MSVAIRAITRIQDSDDAPALGAGQNGYALTWDNASGAFVATALVTDHGALTGLSDDDHAGYALLAGRTGGQTLYGGDAANDDITIHGTSNATRTTSYVLLQPSGGNVGIGTSAPATKLHINQLAATTKRETIAKYSISDAGNDAFYAANGTSVDARYAPIFCGYVESTNATYSQAFWGVTNAANDASDSSAFGLVHISGLITSSATDPLNGSLSNPTYRKLFTVGAASTDIKLTVAATGFVGIGTAAPATLLHANLVSAATNAVTNVVTIGHDTSGTAAAGFGAGLLYQLESSTTAAQSAARIQALWYEATHATRKADLVGTAYDAGGEREGWRVRGNGSAAAIGFLGATPAARIAHVADPSGGATVDAEARSAINSILATLETFGLHASS